MDRAEGGASDAELLGRVVRLYHDTLNQHPEGKVQMPAKIRRRMTLSGGSAEGDTRGRRDSWKKRGAGESRWRLHTSALAVDV